MSEDIHEPSFNEVLQKTTELYKKNFKALMSIAIIAAIIQQACQAYMINLGLPKIMKIASEQGMEAVQSHIDPTKMLTIAFLAIIVGLVELISAAIYVQYINNSWQDKKTSIPDAAKSVLKVFVILIITSVIIKFISGVFMMGILFFIGILLTALFLVYIPIVLFEEKGVIQSLKSCIQLTKRSYLRCVGISVLTMAILTVPALISFAMANAESNIFALDQVIAALLSALIYPWLSVLILTQYYALKAKQTNLGE
jgi:hypothetical protein